MIRFKTNDLSYPLMRDPERQPKCYDLTDDERLAAVDLADRLLEDRDRDLNEGYYGA